MVDVVGLGCACIDFLGIVPHMPGFDEEIQMLEASQQGGGEVATALVALAQLGSHVSYIGKIGDDHFGKLISAEFDSYGVDTCNLIIESGTTSRTSIVLIDEQTGKRTILGVPFTAPEISPMEIKPGIIEEAKYLLLDGISREASLEAARRARKAKVPVVLDADVQVLDTEISKLIEQTDILIPSKNFSEQFTRTEDIDKAMHIFLSYGPSLVLITLGDRGSACFFENEIVYMPAFAVEVIDTTGAGDVFHGAFIHGLLQNWEVKKSIEFASAVAAMKCTKIGGRAGIPDLEEAVSFLKSHGAHFFDDYLQ